MFIFICLLNALIHNYIKNSEIFGYFFFVMKLFDLPLHFLWFLTGVLGFLIVLSSEDWSSCDFNYPGLENLKTYVGELYGWQN